MRTSWFFCGGTWILSGCFIVILADRRRNGVETLSNPAVLSRADIPWLNSGKEGQDVVESKEGKNQLHMRWP
jgi:hypothetical protein